MTKRMTLILAAATLVFAGCTMDITRGSGRIVREDRPVSGFDQVTVSASGTLALIQGAIEGLRIEADDNILPHLRSDVENGVLVIRFDRQNWDQIYRPSRPIKYTLALKTLRGLAVSGSAIVTGDTLTADDLRINASGSSSMRLGSLNVRALTYVLSGSGSAQVAGHAGRQDITISGSGRYLAGDLSSETTRVSISGSGAAIVWALDTLDARISGSASVSYYGRPRVTQSISGSGRIAGLGDK